LNDCVGFTTIIRKKPTFLSTRVLNIPYSELTSGVVRVVIHFHKNPQISADNPQMGTDNP